jgi:hypothetical protein
MFTSRIRPHHILQWLLNPHATFDTNSQNAGLLGPKVEVVQGAAGHFLERLLLKESMLTDHRVDAYLEALQAWLDAEPGVFSLTQDLASTRL